MTALLFAALIAISLPDSVDTLAVCKDSAIVVVSRLACHPWQGFILTPTDTITVKRFTPPPPPPPPPKPLTPYQKREIAVEDWLARNRYNPDDYFWETGVVVPLKPEDEKYHGLNGKQ